MARFPPGWLVDDETEAIGQMVNIDIAPGQPIVRRMFTSPREWGLAVQPAAGQNAIFYSYKQHLYALDAGTGQEVWHFEVKDKFSAVSSPPVVVGDLVYYVVASLDYFQDPQSQLYALETATGRERWHFTETDTEVKRRMPPLPPLIVEGVIYFVTWGGGHLYALDAQTGRERWHFATNGFLSYPAVNGKLITFVSSDGYLYNLDLASGIEQWRAPWPWP
jgi:outer membrane protein assembly factor BamB